MRATPPPPEIAVRSLLPETADALRDADAGSLRGRPGPAAMHELHLEALVEAVDGETLLTDRGLGLRAHAFEAVGWCWTEIAIAVGVASPQDSDQNPASAIRLIRRLAEIAAHAPAARHADTELVDADLAEMGLVRVSQTVELRSAGRHALQRLGPVLLAFALQPPSTEAAP